MKTKLFSFDLPSELIAIEPPKIRGESRLMLLKRCATHKVGKAELGHQKISDFPDFLEKGSLLVFNDTRVRKARIFAKKESNGSLGEFLFINPLPDNSWDCVVNKAKKKRLGDLWQFPGGLKGKIVGSLASDRRSVLLSPPPDENWFLRYGHIPLPPYIRRKDTVEDTERYQTVYAQNAASAAAPTAGLHFTQEILEKIKKKGVELAWLSLQIGPGTFAPVRSENIEDHRMHSERYRITKKTADAVNRAKEEGRPIIAVGSTSVRSLESAWNGKFLEAGEGDSRLFIYPGYRFHVVDKMLTNFHTPHSSLLMMVAAFCGRERLLDAYHRAVAEKYRFFSYGDAMFIH